MLKNYFLVNLLLIIIIGLLSVKLYDTWATPSALPQDLSAGEAAAPEDTQPAENAGNRFLPPASYNVISKANLFHPSRSMSAKQESQKKTVPVSSGKPQLFGTVITGNIQQAIIEDPQTKKTGLYAEKDTVAGYTILEIRRDRVILEKMGASLAIGLRADKKFKRPARVKKRTRQRALKRRRRPARRRPPRRTK